MLSHLHFSIKLQINMCITLDMVSVCMSTLVFTCAYIYVYVCEFLCVSVCMNGGGGGWCAEREREWDGVRTRTGFKGHLICS